MFRAVFLSQVLTLSLCRVKSDAIDHLKSDSSSQCAQTEILQMWFESDLKKI